jgi:hypothetical protein
MISQHKFSEWEARETEQEKSYCLEDLLVSLEQGQRVEVMAWWNRENRRLMVLGAVEEGQMWIG